MAKIKTLLVAFLLFIVSYPIYRPIFDYGFFPIHDDMQFARVKEMADALRDHQFPVRIVKNLGYGYHYPLYNFYAPLPYYTGAFFHLIGFNVLDSTKLMFFLPNFLSVIFIFFLVKKMTKSNVLGILAGILYAYFPYRAVDNYVRGTIGEIYVMMFLPLLILGIYELFNKFKTSNFPCRQVNFKFQIALMGIILSHNIYAFIVLFFFGIFFVVNLFPFLSFRRRPESMQVIFSLFVNTLLSLGTTTFFWLPAIIENGYTQLSRLSRGGYYFGNYFLKLGDLWQSDWGYGGAGGGTSFMIGKIHLLLGLSAVCVLIFRFFSHRSKSFIPAPAGHRNAQAFAGRQAGIQATFFFFLLSVFFTNKLSYFFWKYIPMLSFTQYPMRFIFFADFFLILFIIQVLSRLTNNFSPISLLSLISLISLLVIFKNQPFFRSQFNYEFKEKFVSEKYTRWLPSKMSDEYLPREFKLPINENEIADDSINSAKKTENEILKHTSDEMIVSVGNKFPNNQINFPISYFPGWKLYINAKELIIAPHTKFYLIAANFAKGDYLVKLKFEDTPVRTIGNIISLLSLSLLITMCLIKNKKYG